MASSGVNVKSFDNVLHSKECVSNAIRDFDNGFISRKCCNPNHLRIGTKKDNSQDTKESGRMRGLFDGSNVLYGENSPSAKLSSEEVVNIKNDNRKFYEIAKDYNVNPSTISRIKNEKRRRFG